MKGQNSSKNKVKLPSQMAAHVGSLSKTLLSDLCSLETTVRTWALSAKIFLTECGCAVPWANENTRMGNVYLSQRIIKLQISISRESSVFVLGNELDQTTHCCPISCLRRVFYLSRTALTGRSCSAIFAKRDGPPRLKTPLRIFCSSR